MVMNFLLSMLLGLFCVSLVSSHIIDQAMSHPSSWIEPVQAAKNPTLISLVYNCHCPPFGPTFFPVLIMIPGRSRVRNRSRSVGLIQSQEAIIEELFDTICLVLRLKRSSPSSCFVSKHYHKKLCVNFWWSVSRWILFENKFSKLSLSLTSTSYCYPRNKSTV